MTETRYLHVRLPQLEQLVNDVWEIAITTSVCVNQVLEARYKTGIN